MDRTSLFKIFGLPDSFGVVLLSFSLILLLSPYFSGADFGLFKIPTFGSTAKKWLRVIGPMIFGLIVLFFIPIISTTGSKSGNQNANGTAPTPTASLPPSNTSTPGPTPSVIPPPKSTPTSTLASARQAAEDLGSRWFIAFFRNHDAASVARMSDPPFRFPGILLLQAQDIRQEYEKAIGPPPYSDPSKIQLTNMEVQTIREAKAEGLKQADDPRLDALHVNSDDFVIILTTKTVSQSKLFLFTRKVGSEIKLAGYFIDH